MTIANEDNVVIETGNGVKVAFDYDFVIFETSEINVYKRVTATGVDTLQVEGVDYTATISDSVEGGTVTYTVAPTALEQSLLEGNIPYTQGLDIPSVDTFPEQALENSLDRATRQIQQVNNAVERSVKLPLGSTLDVTIPEPSAGKAIVGNSTSDGYENSTYTVDDIPAATAADAASAASSASAASTSEINAAASEVAAAASAVDAANSAAGVNLPSVGAGDAAKLLQVNVGETGYELTATVDTDQIAADAIDGTKIEDDAIDSEHIVDGAVDNVHLATGIDAVKLADGSVTNAELQYINSLSSNAQDQIDSKVSSTWDYDSGWFAVTTALATKAHGITLSFPDDILESKIFWRASSSGSYAMEIAPYTGAGNPSTIAYDGTNFYVKASPAYARYYDSAGAEQGSTNGEIRLVSRKIT